MTRYCCLLLSADADDYDDSYDEASDASDGYACNSSACQSRSGSGLFYLAIPTELLVSINAGEAIVAGLV